MHRRSRRWRPVPIQHANYRVLLSYTHAHHLPRGSLSGPAAQHSAIGAPAPTGKCGARCIAGSWVAAAQALHRAIFILSCDACASARCDYRCGD